MLPKKYKKVIRRMAAEQFPEKEEAILAKADAQYDEFIRTTPDIGGKENMQFKDLDFLIAFFSFYEACDRRIGIPEFEQFADGVMVKPSKKAGCLVNWNSSIMPKVSLIIYSKYKRKIDEHVAKGEWGNTWRVDINPEGHQEGFAIHTRMCPNWDFCRAYGYEAFMPAVCAQDHRIAEAMHGVLIRTHTVANGDDYCDWWYFGDKQKLPEEAQRRLKEKK